MSVDADHAVSVIRSSWTESLCGKFYSIRVFALFGPSLNLPYRGICSATACLRRAVNRRWQVFLDCSSKHYRWSDASVPLFGRLALQITRKWQDSQAMRSQDSPNTRYRCRLSLALLTLLDDDTYIRFSYAESAQGSGTSWSGYLTAVRKYFD